MRLETTILRILQVQVLLAFFFPPFAFTDKQVFAADLWLFLWVPLVALATVKEETPRNRRHIFEVIGGLTFLFGLVFLHGYFRLPLAPLLGRYLDVPKEDGFSFVKEGVNAGRFACACLGGYLVSRFRIPTRPLLRTLAITAGIASLTMALAKVFPGFRATLGNFYHYNPEAADWAGRMYGIFRSPIEASATLSFSLLLLMNSFPSGKSEKRLLMAISILILAGIALSRSMTAFLALTLTLGTLVVLRRPFRQRLAVLAILLVVLPGAWWFFWNDPLFAFKRDNLLFRFVPWSIYFHVALSRLDLLLLGNGFHPHFSDNIIVFLFSRGGLLLVLVSSVAMLKFCRRSWAELSDLQRAIPLFLFVSGMTIDSIILRPVAFLIIAVAIPIMQERRLHGADSSNRGSNRLRDDGNIQ